MDEFKNIYLELENITFPPKVHILFNHVEEYISKFGIDQKSLGFYNEQTGEKYKIENTNAENYGLRLRKVELWLNLVRYTYSFVVVYKILKV